MGEVRQAARGGDTFRGNAHRPSVYATLHADNAQETITRPDHPANIHAQGELCPRCAAIVVQFRHRRLNVRSTLEFAEVQKGGDINTLYRWDVKTDKINEVGKMVTLSATLSACTLA